MSDNQKSSQENVNENTEERLTVEVPTEIRAGRSSSDCYTCSTQEPLILA